MTPSRPEQAAAAIAGELQLDQAAGEVLDQLQLDGSDPHAP